MKDFPLKISDLHFGYTFARAQFSFITGQPKDRRLGYHQIKTLLRFPQLCEAADFVTRNIRPQFRELMFGNALPKTYEALGKCGFSYPAESIVQEINWVLICVRKYSYELNLFIAYKERYEFHLLLGDYENAERFLTKIEEEICVSVWSLENRFLLMERKHGVDENKEFLSKFNEENKSERFTKALAHYLSLRAEKSLSVDRYNSDLRNDLEGLRGSRKSQHQDYYLFKLSFLNNFDFQHFSEILAYDFHHSIIDRYLNLQKVLTSLLTSTNEVIGSIEGGETVKAYISSRLNYLMRKVEDPMLFKLKLLASDKLFPAFSEKESSDEIKVIDKYTTGLYQEVEEDLIELLLKKPTQFDLYVLYVKALVYQKKKFKSIGDKTSIQNLILNEMFKIVSVSVSPAEAGLYLTRIANNISSCVLSYGIVDFVNHETKGKNERKLFARLSYNPANPIIHEIYPEVPTQIAYLEMLKAKFADSITVDFLLKKVTDSDNLSWFENHIPEAKYKIEVAKLNQRKGNVAVASQIWEQLILSNQGTTPILETAIRNQYLCLEELQRYDQCVNLYVNSFFTNQFIVDKIETERLQKKIRERRFRVVPPTIDLPLFYTISSTDETEIHTAFEKFNLQEGVFRPSELLPHFENYPKQKILFFLKHTCSPEILKHSIHINGSKDRLEERLKILQFLKDKDLEDKKFYEDEIKSITNILIIQKGLLELDESKIYVNEQGIINTELKDYEALYSNFKAFSKIAEKSKVWMLEKTGRLVTYNYSEEGYDKEKVEYSSNPVYDVYKELFDAIKDKFLNSKFGIVAYLSTRIRHGVLIGELRPIFEKHKLITQKEGDTSLYRKNTFWENNLRHIPEIQRAKVQDCLNDFSYAIDGLIYDLIKKYLQVYHLNTNPDGWFNYDFQDENLFWFSIKALKTRDFNEFANEVFEILWERTDVNLQAIREQIQVRISQQFNEQFDTLERDVSNIIGVPSSQHFVKAVKDCSTETQNVIKRISSWFKRSGTATSDFQLDTLIDIVMEYCNKSHPHQKVNLERKLEFNCTIKGEFYTHFADLFRIFFENILKHADEKAIIIDARILTHLEGEFLKVCIQNVITKKESVDALKTVWDEKTMNIAKLKEEGKSGYHKAYKILNSDLKNERNVLATSVEEDQFTVLLTINVTDIRK